MPYYHFVCPIIILCADGDWKLLLVSHASSIGVLPHWGEVYCIERIAIVTLSTDPSTPEVIGLEVHLSSHYSRAAQCERFNETNSLGELQHAKLRGETFATDGEM